MTDTEKEIRIKKEKRKIRREALKKRDALSEEERKRGTILLTERISGHQWFYRAEEFLCFVSYGSEISTWDILKEAIRLGKKVYVPKVVREKEAEMSFYRITSTDELTEGFRGIPEPVGDTQEYVYVPERAERTLMLMPGAAFDRFRNRIGYGKGFYDRYLADKPLLQLRTIAVGYQCQLLGELPASVTDIKPYQIICV